MVQGVMGRGAVKNSPSVNDSFTYFAGQHIFMISPVGGDDFYVEGTSL